MSFNIRTKTVMDVVGNRWGSRKDLLIHTVDGFNPDVLGTQECGMDQAQDIQRELKRYSFVGRGRNGGGGGEMCGIFYRTDKFQKLEEGHFWLSETPDVPGSKSWGNMFPRMASWVKLRPKAGGEDFYFFNTHLDISGGARPKEAEFLHAHMARIASRAPVVLTGDFNDDEGTPAYAAMTTREARGGLPLIDTFRSLFTSRAPGQGSFNGFHGKVNGPRIDWILTSPHFATVAAGIDHTHAGGRYPSDHFPVTAIVRLKPTVAAYAAAAKKS